MILSKSKTSLSLESVSRLSGLKKTSCVRLLKTMLEVGFIEQESETLNYRLGYRNISVGAAALESISLRKIAHPYMQELQELTKETINLSVLDGTDVVFIERIEAAHILSSHHLIGDRIPVHTSSIGKVILAYQPKDERNEVIDKIKFQRKTSSTIISKEAFERELQKVKNQGMAFNNHELEVGLCAIAVPILGHHGKAVAGLNVAFPSARHDFDTALREFAPALKSASKEISHKLGFVV